jgi:hypothetical protein
VEDVGVTVRDVNTDEEVIADVEGNGEIEEEDEVEVKEDGEVEEFHKEEVLCVLLFALKGSVDDTIVSTA